MGSDTGEAQAAAPVPRNGDLGRLPNDLPLESSFGYVVTDDAGIICEINDAAAAWLQGRREFVVGKPLGMFVTDAYRPAFYDRLARQRHEDHSAVFETRVSRAGRGATPVIVTVSSLLGDGKGSGWFRWLLRDISEALRTEQALRAERELLDSIIAAAQAIILVLDENGYIVRSNPYASAATGYKAHDLAGFLWADMLVSVGDRSALVRLLGEARSFRVARSGVVPLPVSSGSPREVVWSIRWAPHGESGSLVLVGHDVTELQQAQRRALESERLAAIGQMAAGIAHESRNALQRMQACLSMLGLRSQNEPAVLDLIDRAQKAQDDLHHLFDDLRSYAAALVPRLVPTDVAGVWRHAWTDLVTVQPSTQAELREDLGDAETTCDIDPFQMKRVFRNLFENALAACPAPVCITVCCRPTPHDGVAALAISIRDNGPGFPAGQTHRLFEPFFTTKTHGTGLGLAICRRIIEAHGGRIEAGQPGPGAEICITLPRRMP
jgi:PAS domain S-box-containing protein